MGDDLIIIPKTRQLSLLDEDECQGEDSLLVTCEICFEPVMFPNKQFQNSNRCIHPFCTDCVIKYIQTKLDDNVSDIKCPYPTCAHSLDPLSCRLIVSNQLFTRWCDALCESTALGFEGVYCPNNECSELIMNEFGDGNVKRCVCPSCTKPFCFQCKVPWHDGYTCEETRDGNNVDFAVVCQKNGWNWKRCPKCGHCIEIDPYCYRVGCWVLKCRCGSKFCYECGKKVPFWHQFDMVYICCRPLR